MKRTGPLPRHQPDSKNDRPLLQKGNKFLFCMGEKIAYFFTPQYHVRTATVYSLFLLFSSSISTITHFFGGGKKRIALSIFNYSPPKKNWLLRTETIVIQANWTERLINGNSELRIEFMKMTIISPFDNEGGCHCGRVKYQLNREKPLSAKYCMYYILVS